MSTRAATPDFTLSRDCDGEGDVVCIYLHGHHGDIQALQWAVSIWRDEELGWDDNGELTDAPEWGFAQPRKVWLRQVPTIDGYLAHHVQHYPARGARPVTAVSIAAEHKPCAVCGNQWKVALRPNTDNSYLVAEERDCRDRGDVLLCGECWTPYAEHVRAVHSAVLLPCPDCGHLLGMHARYGHGSAYPCGFSHTEPCTCTHVSPHEAVFDLNDLHELRTERLARA